MTYSIIARDPDSGALGVAVQSHYFSVGYVVPWARVGVGAIATQSMAEVSYGPLGLEAMAAGATAEAALAGLLAEDEGRESRQVAMIDARGGVAAHTGADCIVHAGHITAEDVSCQANIMVTPEIWPAMLAAYRAASAEGLSMARRLLAALDAAEALGGDARGRQSAAIVVVPGEGPAWARDVDLRVEDDPEPLVEMRRLLDIHEAYELASAADDALVAGERERAGELFRASRERLPDSHELTFWAALAHAGTGDLDRAAELAQAAIATQPGWAWLLPRLDERRFSGAAALAHRLGLEPATD